MVMQSCIRLALILEPECGCREVARDRFLRPSMSDPLRLERVEAGHVDVLRQAANGLTELDLAVRRALSRIRHLVFVKRMGCIPRAGASDGHCEGRLILRRALLSCLGEEGHRHRLAVQHVRRRTSVRRAQAEKHGCGERNGSRKAQPSRKTSPGSVFDDRERGPVLEPETS